MIIIDLIFHHIRTKKQTLLMQDTSEIVSTKAYAMFFMLVIDCRFFVYVITMETLNNLHKEKICAELLHEFSAVRTV